MIPGIPPTGYDIIGDVHGQADKLVALLGRMGYAERAGAWQHPQRQAIFVGDFVDRGPQQLRSVELVRAMVEGGHAQAVMGNHEFNAIAWFLRDPDRPGQFLREHSEQNRQQHRAFLAEVEGDPALHARCIDWFLTLPLWLELDGFRVVHACWHPGCMVRLEQRLAAGRRLTRELMQAASRKGGSAFDAVETIAKGPEIALPDGHSFLDKDGHERRRVRTRWWDTAASTYRQAALLDDDLRDRLPEAPLPAGHRPVHDDAKPIFFGHYWLTGTPQVLSPKLACLDYSAGKGGPLVAYRWSGEATLDSAHLVTSD